MIKNLHQSLGGKVIPPVMRAKVQSNPKKGMVYTSQGLVKVTGRDVSAGDLILVTRMQDDSLVMLNNLSR